MSDVPFALVSSWFRSGSTAMWAALSRNADNLVFYEPLHPSLAAEVKHGTTLSSHVGVDDYWRQYREMDGWEKWAGPRMAYEHSWLEPEMRHQPLEDYLCFFQDLHNTYQRRVILQVNRMGFRLGWFKQRFPQAPVVHISRNPRDVWVSIRRHLPQAAQHDTDHPDAFEFAQFCTALGVEIPFLLNIKDAYSRFYLLWQMQERLGRKNADCVIAFQDLHNDKDAVWQSLCAVGLMETSDIPICRAAIEPGSGHSGWQAWQGDEQWWSDREVKAEEILQTSGLCHLDQQSLSDIRQAHQPAWQTAFEQLDLAAQSRTWLCHYANARAEQTRLLARIRELESHQSS